MRVFCRVRPPLANELGTIVKFKVEDANPKVLSMSITDKQVVKKSWKLDQVFNLDASQDAVFEEVEAITKSVTDGYRACIFAYGQTGSGKTHTMTGGEGEMRGMIPRAVESLFNEMVKMKELGWATDMQASFVEVT